MGGCRTFENTTPDSDGRGGAGAEVVEACGAGDPGVEGVDGGTAVGVEKVRPEAALPACGGFMKFEDHVFLLPAKSVIAWACTTISNPITK